MDGKIPKIDVVLEYCQKTTPIKDRIQGAVNFLGINGIKSFNKDVFWANGVSHATGYRILKSSNFRTLKNDSMRKRTRGKKRIITQKQIKKMEIILENEGLEEKRLT